MTFHPGGGTRAGQPYSTSAKNVPECQQHTSDLQTPTAGTRTASPNVVSPVPFASPSTAPQGSEAVTPSLNHSWPAAICDTRVLRQNLRLPLGEQQPQYTQTTFCMCKCPHTQHPEDAHLLHPTCAYSSTESTKWAQPFMQIRTLHPPDAAQHEAMHWTLSTPETRAHTCTIYATAGQCESVRAHTQSR